MRFVLICLLSFLSVGAAEAEQNHVYDNPRYFSKRAADRLLSFSSQAMRTTRCGPILQGHECRKRHQLQIGSLQFRHLYSGQRRHL